VLYEMLSGLPADSFPRLGERAREIASDPTLAQLNRVALRAAQRDHHLRYAHAGEMRDELERIAAKAPSKRQLDPRQRRRWRIAAAATTLPLLAALLAAPLLRERFLSNPDSTSELEAAANLPSATRATVSSSPGVSPTSTNSPAASVQLDATPVEVNFVSNTFEAEIYLDDQLLRGPDGRPLKTPCTAWRIAPTRRRVRLVHPVEGEIDLGEIDFAKVREVVARW
jgi:hypothetical protein